MLKKTLCIIFAVLCIVSVAVTVSADSTAGENVKLADTTLDNSIDIRDATNIQKHVAQIVQFSTLQIAAADVDRSSSVNVKDATALQKFLAGFSINYPIGKLVNVNGDLVEDDTTPTQPEETQPTTTMTEPTTEAAKPTEPEPTYPSVNTNPPDYDESDSVTAEVLKKVEEGFLRLVNEERKRNGVCELTINEHLDDVAQIRSKEIIEKFSHTRPDGSSCFSLVDLQKYPHSNLGENLCMCTHIANGVYNPSTDRFVGSEKQIEAVYTNIFTAFKNSETHYANMIRGSFEHTGIGITYVLDGDIPYFYVCHTFGGDF